MMPLWLAALICLVALATFTACEAALTSVSRIRLRHWAGKRLSGADAEELLQRPRALLTMAFVGSNLSIVGFAVTVTALLVSYVPMLRDSPLLAAMMCRSGRSSRRVRNRVSVGLSSTTRTLWRGEGPARNAPKLDSKAVLR